MKKYFSILISTILFISIGIPVQAQSQNPPASGGSEWANYIAPNGTLTQAGVDAGVVDNGVVHESASYMPSIAGYQVPATFHEYTASDGSEMKMPTLSTLTFMAANSQESGLSSAQIISNSTGTTIIGTSELANGSLNLGSLTDASAWSAIANSYTSTLATTIRDGGNGWTTLTNNQAWNLISNFVNQSIADLNLLGNGDHNLDIYTVMLLYPPGTVDLANRIKDDKDTPPPQQKIDPPPPQGSCRGPEVIPGTISTGMKKIYPNYPVVVGQDDNKIGVTISYSLTISPTIYHTWELVVHHHSGCSVSGSGPCPKGKETDSVTYECVMHTQLFCEAASTHFGSASLTKGSRDWILGDLAAHYPGAQLKHPDWQWGDGGGGCGGATYSWSMQKPNIQVADPGDYDTHVFGSTSGTPVSGGRGFNQDTGMFHVGLIESTIIQ